MNCELVNQKIETLTLAEVATVLPTIQAHLETCETCQHNYQQQLAYLQLMRTVKTPDLHPAAASKMLRTAGEQKQTTKPSATFIQGFIAASVLAISILGTYTVFTNNEQTNELVVTTTESNENNNVIDTEVVLVINSPTDISGADLDLVLPEEVTIVGLENIQQLSWPVDLKKGVNTLELPIRVNMNKALEQPLSIIATLYHEANERNFEIDIGMTKS